MAREPEDDARHGHAATEAPAGLLMAGQSLATRFPMVYGKPEHSFGTSSTQPDAIAFEPVKSRPEVLLRQGSTTALYTTHQFSVRMDFEELSTRNLTGRYLAEANWNGLKALPEGWSPAEGSASSSAVGGGQLVPSAVVNTNAMFIGGGCRTSYPSRSNVTRYRRSMIVIALLLVGALIGWLMS